MSLVGKLIGFGLRQVLDVAPDSVVEAVVARFRDHSQTLPRALARANDRAWQSLGVALAGDGLLDRIKTFFASGDDKGIREQVQLFLNDNAFSLGDTPDKFRLDCLDELKRLRKSGLLSSPVGSAAEIARQAAGFKRHADPQGLVGEAQRAVGQVADALIESYPNLARLLRTPTPAGPPLLAAAFCYFFRREVETNSELAHGLFFDGLRQLTASQAKAFGEVGQALDTLGERFDQAIEEVLQELLRVRMAAEAAAKAAAGAERAAAATHGAVLDLQNELQRLGGLHLANADEVRSLLVQVQQHLSLVGMQKGEVRPHQSFSIRGEDERQAVKSLLARFRELPTDERHKVPALLNGLGKLQLGAGDFAEASRTFTEVVAVVPDVAAKAEASFNAYRAALEQKQWATALDAIRQAAGLDPARFAPFPLHRYEPKRILGAGGFGTAVLCHDRHFDEDVVVKTLHAADLDRGLDDVFREARTLRRLSHPAIIGVRDCDYAEPMGKARPYLVMDYFPGGTLEQFIEQRGTLTPEHVRTVALQVASGMRAAHNQNILHRDLKPANVLVRKEGNQWQVKIIDFGLALRKQVVETSMAARSAGNTILSDSVAGTLKYAPPEQMGELRGVKAGTHSDVYAFGKTCCYALFKTTEPRRRQWGSIPAEMADVLEQCIEQELDQRHTDFGPVLAVLEALDPACREAERRRKEAEEERGRQEQARRQEAEEKLARLVWDALDRTRGKPTAEDTTAANELVRQHRIDRERAKAIFREVRERWQKEQPQEARLADITTVPLGQGIEMKFAWIPPGTFLMGSPASEPERGDNETQHRVTLTKGYWLGIHQVTQAQWQAVMGDNPSKFEGDNLPVESVSWNDCQEFVEKLGRQTGKRFRLPTEAEWEYACRAGTTTPFCFGETISTDQANYDGHYTYGKGKKGVVREKTMPVGSFPANAWGLFDLHGNVWEWCQDGFGDYPQRDIEDPQGQSSGTFRVLRGGSWYFNPGSCRSACRSRNGPGFRFGGIGCRVLLCLD